MRRKVYGEHNQMLLLSLALTAMSWLSLNLISLLSRIGTHGIISSAVTIIGVIAGIGGFVSGIVAIVLFLVGQKNNTTLY
ncbi:hypothetical protein QP805_09060 [Streptococcus pasteurianus]|uniref:hypothetical protein n=1 Tax=Streptococcus TaxID=1301 RepID=UPI0025557C32|nr:MULTISPECIES: hypothetical protein [Streptococcus]MDK8394828.1 hypothetical protein [Streptococcus pasteurianus]